jgi:hypothetical protein
VDLAPYADHARMRAEQPAAAPRVSFPRRSLLEASAAAAAGSAVGGIDASASEEGSSTFDVPAFLRRQEG